MGADLSRIRSNPLLDFAGVELKQGGVVLDADFNELVAVVDRRLRAAASDILGRSTVSSTTPDAFKITVPAGALSIGKGRLYVDGLLAENHGALSADPAKKLFDPLMSETVFADAIGYLMQPYLPSPPALPTAGRHLVYLDVWQREVTYLERPELVEPAVGVETSSRQQTVWQVRVLDPDAANATCASPDADVAGWTALIAPSSGRLTTGTFDVPPDTDPCELPPSGGYRGLENQTYRVEIHDAGQPGAGATFKWSRENASVGSRVASMVSATELELQTLGRDEVLRFNTGDWVEITDDVRELSQRAGEMRQITVNEAAQRITFTPALPAGIVPATFPNADFPLDRNLRVRRWDQKHDVLRVGAGGSTPVFQDLDAGTTGLINVPAVGTTLLLENGVTVNFGVSGNKGFRAGDCWVFAARTADASVELLTNAPPRGIHHHYARLGIWDAAAGTVTDCRTPWPPRGEGHDCSCTECVTAESHANGTLTIQVAVDRLHDTGGTVCLGVGQFQLQEPVRLNGAHAVRIRGEGAATLIVTPGGAFSITNGIALAIEDLVILSLGREPAISVRTALGLALRRLLIAVLGGSDTPGTAIFLSGAVIGASIDGNIVIAPVAIRSDVTIGATPSANAAKVSVLLTAELRVEGNLLLCERSGIRLAGRVLQALDTRIAENQIVGCRDGGILLSGLAVPGSSTRMLDNDLNVNGPGIAASIGGLWIEGNKVSATAQRNSRISGGAAIVLSHGLDPGGMDQCQILANQIRGFIDAAIAIRAPVRSLIIKLNLIDKCGNGIVCEEDANLNQVSIENNQLSDIGPSDRGFAGSVVGIGVARAADATVAGNSVRRVGQSVPLARLSAGIATAGVLNLCALANRIAGIAPADEFSGVGAGLLLQAPFSQGQVAHNHIERDEVLIPKPGKSDWYAVRIDQAEDGQEVPRFGVHAAVKFDSLNTIVFGMSRPYIVTAVAISDAAGALIARGISISVLGNVMTARGGSPSVLLTVSGDCLFNDNRCEQFGNPQAVVRVRAEATIVNANRVRGGEVSVQLLGNPKQMTVLGNITTGPIVPPLGQPWDSLNVRG